MLRPATRPDAETIARIYRVAVRTCLPYLPNLHSPDEELRFFRDIVMQRRQLWVADTSGIQGFCAFGDGWLEHLYVHPDHHRQGTGSALLNLVKRSGPVLQLWAFQRNTNAIRFYERHGFRIVEATDGARNEEQEPDVRMLWEQPGEPHN